MMEAAGFNTIRIAESTWSTWEPREGEFDFTHLHRMLDCAAKHGLSVIVGTPTYAIPAWLAKKCPDILAQTHQGREIYGRRQNMDITHPVYREHCRIMIERLMKEVCSCPHVIGFQLDNETKHYDTCTPRAQKMFVEELKKNWPDLQEFNRAFGLDYWSNRIDDWENFPDIRGTINGSLAAEYARFQRRLVTDFLSWQAELVSRYKRPDQFLTQNFDFEWRDYSFGLQPEVNQYEAASGLTVAGCDIYHPSQGELTGNEITACGNIARGIRQENYLVLETQAQGQTGWLAYPGQLTLQAYSHIANGANSVSYWHWHSIHNAIETYWKGVLSHDLAENETYRECSLIGNEWKRIGSHLCNLRKTNRIAIFADNASLTGLSQFPMQTWGSHTYNNILRWLADALFHMNIEYDIVEAKPEYLEHYECVILPSMYSATDDFLLAAKTFVEKGGALIATCRTAFADEYLKVRHDTQPYLLTEVFGIRYDRFTYPKDVTVSFADKTSEAREWMELVTCEGAQPLAMYGHSVWNRYCAAACHSYGKGLALYLGTIFGEETLVPMLEDFFQRAGIRRECSAFTDAAYPVAVKQGINDSGNRITCFLNYSDLCQTAVWKAGNALELRSGNHIQSNETLELLPWGVLILESEG